MLQQLNDLLQENKDWIVEQRRYLHQFPEASQNEYETSKRIISILEDFNVDEIKTGFYQTGVTGLIRGNQPGPTIGLRFDIDALEMEEKTGLPFASKNQGLMHACGHDGHTAMGLGAALVLMKLKDQFPGNIKLIFQPAEEDGQNGGGAQYLIKEGVLKDPEVSAILGMHIWPNLAAGKIATRSGVIMGASDPFQIDISGQGGHASQPHFTVDPIVVGSQIINNLQTIVSRNIDPFDQAVISVGIFDGGTRYNTIPDQVTLKGTVRTFNQEVRDKVEARMTEIIEKTAEGLGGRAELNYTRGYPPVVNDQELVRLAETTLAGSESLTEVVLAERPAPTGEDFAYFARAVPGLFLWLGANESGESLESPGLHSPYFNFPEEILLNGIQAVSSIAINWLKNQEAENGS